MLSLAAIRPKRHDDFDDEAKEFLALVRGDVKSNKNAPNSDMFAKRHLWSERKHKERFEKPTKCGYCESKRRRRAELHVEHYRPKSEVKEWTFVNWKSESCIREEPVPSTPVPAHGYWWLAFDWDNYSLACFSCNSVFKGNLFPIDGRRGACVEGGHSSERPLLLNPYEVFEAREHFEWDNKGFLHPLSHRGRATILVCGLNCEDLVAERRQYLLDTVVTNFSAWRSKKGDPAMIAKLASIGSVSAPYAGMVRWYFESTFRFRTKWSDCFDS